VRRWQRHTIRECTRSTRNTTRRIDSVEASRKTLPAATSIAYSDSASGTFLSTTRFAKLGIADQVAGKSRKLPVVQVAFFKRTTP
jgi:hypothetical protein